MEIVKGGSTAVLEQIETTNKARGSVNDPSARASKKVGLLAQFTLVPNKASAITEASGKILVVVTD